MARESLWISLSGSLTGSLLLSLWLSLDLSLTLALSHSHAGSISLWLSPRISLRRELELPQPLNFEELAAKFSFKIIVNSLII